MLDFGGDCQREIRVLGGHCRQEKNRNPRNAKRVKFFILTELAVSFKYRRARRYVWEGGGGGGTRTGENE